MAVPRVAAAADRLFGGDGDKVGRSPPQIIGDSILRISNGSFFFFFFGASARLYRVCADRNGILHPIVPWFLPPIQLRRCLFLSNFSSGSPLVTYVAATGRAPGCETTQAPGITSCLGHGDGAETPRSPYRGLITRPLHSRWSVATVMLHGRLSSDANPRIAILIWSGRPRSID